MKTFSFLKILSAIVLLLVSIHCSTSSAADSSTRTLFIASETKDCTGVAPMKCLQVREKTSENWQNFYSNIEGFTYEPGFEYELKVRTEKLENVPADASSLKYVLVKEVSKVKK